MKKYTYLLLAVFTLGLFSCTSEKQKKINEIDALNEEVGNFKEGKPDFNKVNTYLAAIEDFNTEFPEDTLNMKYLYDAAQFSLSIENPTQCVQYTSLLLEKYGYIEQMSKALFLKAFVEENYLGNLQAAKASYQLFIEKYPNEEKMCKDSQVAIDNLGMSPDELLEKILQKKTEEDSLKVVN